MVKDQDYFSASLTVRRVLVRQLYQHNVQMLEEAIRVEKSQ
jgi:hypothetical protein